ncbi:MAG: ATP-binding protein [Thermoproteota archaeon]|nr:adenine nucleotide alpha hydrolase family protein [Candidatus Brockarchaeota archaeon]
MDIKRIVEKRVMEEVKKYPPFNRALIALSGGKDSASLLHIFKKILPDKEILPVYLNLGIDGFSEKSEEFARIQAEKNGLKLIVFNVRKELGFTIMDARRVYPKVCSVCGSIKRYLLNKIAYESGADIILTAHHLDDFLIRMLKSTLNAEIEELVRFKPYLPRNDNLVARGRPFWRVPESFISRYAHLEGLSFITEKCPIGMKKNIERIRKAIDILAVSENQKNVYLSSLVKIARKLEENVVPFEKAQLKPCSSCGFLSSNVTCSFCVRVKKIRSFIEGKQ